jgi:hypothetical protein
MKKFPLLVVVILLAVASIGMITVFSNKTSIKGFLPSVYSTVSGGFQTQKVEAADSTGSLVIQISGAGRVVNDGRTYSFVKDREATQEEINSLTFKIFSHTTYVDTVVKTGVKAGQTVTLPAGNYIVNQTNTSGANAYFPASYGCYAGDASISSGETFTCSGVVNLVANPGGVGGGSETNIVNPYAGAVAGPSATLPTLNSSVATATFQKIVLDLSNAKTTINGYTYRSMINDMVQYKMGGKNYLLVKTSLTANSTGSIYVYDITNPLAPVFLKQNTVDLSSNDMANPQFIILDDYPYFILTNAGKTTEVFKLDATGSISLVKTLDISTASPIYLVRVGNKVYLAAYAADNSTLYPNNDPYKNGIVTKDAVNNEGSGRRQVPAYTNAILFYDVTNGINSPNKSDIISGMRVKNQNSFDLTEDITWPYSSKANNSFVLNFSNDTYFGMYWYWIVHRLHSSSKNLMVLNVTDIFNPTLVVDGQNDSEVAKIFNQSLDITPLENGWLDYQSSFVTLIDATTKTAVHWYDVHVAGLGLFAPTFDANTVRENLNKARLRDYVAGYSLTSSTPVFNEISGTRTVVCEQRGGDEDTNNACGRKGDSNYPFNSIDFGQPIAYKSGLIISSTGKIGLISGNQISFADTSAEFLKYKNFLDNAEVYSGNYQGNTNSFPVADGIIASAGNNSFAVFVNKDYHVELVKIVTSSSIPTSGGGGGGIGANGNVSTTTLQTLQQSLFSFQNLLNIFKRIYAK